MKDFEKEILKYDLKKEEDILKALKAIYKQAAADTKEKLKVLMTDETLQSKIYQSKYQKALLEQLADILQKLNKEQYQKIGEYLEGCYCDGFISAQYMLQKQGIPIVLPIVQNQVVKALKTDSKISEGLYRRMGKDTTKLKKRIAAEISRGIASNSTYSHIALNLDSAANIGFNNAMRITRTEGGRIQSEATFEAMNEAKKMGAEVAKRWDSTLDNRTRESHAQVDGEIRELDEPFSNGLMYPRDPSGSAEEVINCRCALLQKARWLLDENETKYFGDASKMTEEQLLPISQKLNISTDELRKYSKQIIPVKAKNYEDFKRQYEKIWNYEKVE